MLFRLFRNDTADNFSFYLVAEQTKNKKPKEVVMEHLTKSYI